MKTMTKEEIIAYCIDVANKSNNDKVYQNSLYDFIKILNNID